MEANLSCLVNQKPQKYRYKQKGFMTDLASITHLIIDMDGVLYRGDKPLPRLLEFFAFLRRKPIPFILATNNSTKTPQDYVAKLARMGVEIFPAYGGQGVGAGVSGRYKGARFWDAGLTAGAG